MSLIQLPKDRHWLNDHGILVKYWTVLVPF